MTATPPFVVSADDLIVRSAPRNQRASPSPGCIAMAMGDASGASAGIDMGASLPMPPPFVQLRARNECGRLRGVAQARWPARCRALERLLRGAARGGSVALRPKGAAWSAVWG